MKKYIHGGDIYRYPGVLDFSVNCNPYGMPDGVKKAVIEGLNQAECYPDVNCMRLRGAIGEAEKIPQEQIICGNGAADLIFALVFALKPKKALLMAPTFAEYQQALEAVGCEVCYAWLKKENGFVPDEEFIEQISEETDLVFFCNPNNPTGVAAERVYVRRLADRCRSYGAFLVLDECFIDFLEQPEQYTMKAFLNEFPGMFLLKAFTKKYAMPGLRLGYGFCSDEQILEKTAAVMQPWNVSTLAQEAGIAALKETAYVRETLEKIRGQRKILIEGLKQFGCRVYASEANYIFFQGPKQLAKKCLEYGILIRDCSNYEGLSEGFYRIAVRKPEENKMFLETLRTIIETKGGK